MKCPFNVRISGFRQPDISYCFLFPFPNNDNYVIYQSEGEDQPEGGLQPLGGLHQPPRPLPGEEAYLPQLLRPEGAGVDHGEPHQIHQGGRHYPFVWINNLI